MSSSGKDTPGGAGHITMNKQITDDKKKLLKAAKETKKKKKDPKRTIRLTATYFQQPFWPEDNIVPSLKCLKQRAVNPEFYIQLNYDLKIYKNDGQ